MHVVPAVRWLTLQFSGHAAGGRRPVTSLGASRNIYKVFASKQGLIIESRYGNVW